MKIGGIGIPELIIILVVVLLIFGPKNLPKLGSALGKTVKNLREGMGGEGDADDAVDEEAEIVEDGPFSDPDRKTAKKSAPAKKKVVKKAVEEAEVEAEEVVEE